MSEADTHKTMIKAVAQALGDELLNNGAPMRRLDAQSVVRTVFAHRPLRRTGPDVDVSAPLDPLNY